MSFKIPQNNWNDFFKSNQKELKKIQSQLKEREIKHTGVKFFPTSDKIFRAFELCDLDKTKVVIIGQDCYHSPNQSNGLCFSVDKGVKHPPSLRNIIKEMKNDLTGVRETGDFSDLASQGVLLLNSSLTVMERCAGSHMNIWVNFTDSVIEYLSKKNTDLVFILWGNYAKSKKEYIFGKHFILEGTHPSPLGANRGGFFGGKYFTKTNYYLKMVDKEPIKWLF
uniref:Uracil-DNA glycosylase-like domain-containing protein n=1 Tax=viral metagenome TaxID=1070528 RepID=A0A6C0B557_9ZZZZ